MGSLAGLPLRRVSSSACGPAATKLRPWYPSVSQAAKDVGLPDRSGSSGWTIPGRVVKFWGWNTRLAPARKPRTRTPLMSVIASTTTIAVPMNSATSSCNRQRRMKYRAIVLITSIRTRVAPTHAPPTSTAMNSVRRYPSVVGPSMPTTADTWRCHAAAGISISTDAASGQHHRCSLDHVLHPLRRRPPGAPAYHEAAEQPPSRTRRCRSRWPHSRHR